jgi:hypothetical protein
MNLCSDTKKHAKFTKEFIPGNLYSNPRLDDKIRICIELTGRGMLLVYVGTGEVSSNAPDAALNYIDVTEDYCLTKL